MLDNTVLVFRGVTEFCAVSEISAPSYKCATYLAGVCFSNCIIISVSEMCSKAVSSSATKLSLAFSGSPLPSKQVNTVSAFSIILFPSDDHVDNWALICLNASNLCLVVTHLYFSVFCLNSVRIKSRPTFFRILYKI